MFGFIQDFIHNGGNYMILDKREGLTSTELHRVQISMMTAMKIPHLLPLRLKEINFKVSLQYDITDKKMLTHLLKSEKLTMDQFYALLLQLVHALEESTSYMLDMDKYIIQEDYIFVEGPLQDGKLYVTYCPIQSLPNAEPLQSSLSQFITKLMTSVSELQGNGIQKLLQYMNDEGFTLSGMKGLLLDLIAKVSEHTPLKATYPSRPSSHSHRSHTNSIPNSNSFLTQTSLTSTSTSTSTSTPIRSVMSYVPDAVPAFDPKRSYDLDLSIEKEDEEYEPGPLATYISLGCLVACALAWRYLYMAHPGTGMLIVSILVTGILGVIAWMGWIGKIRMPIKGEESFSQSDTSLNLSEFEDASLIRRKASTQVEKISGFFGQSSKDKVLEPSREKWVFPDSRKMESKERDHVPQQVVENLLRDNDSEGDGDPQTDYYVQLSHRTEMLSSPRVNATVLLQPENHTNQDNHSKIRRPEPYLERREIEQVAKNELVHNYSAQGNQGIVRIELNVPHFIIGRTAEVAQFVEETQGTSRAHVEISKGKDGCVIKDLGSKNGTLLNKEMMVPYKEYPLHDGDIFTIVKGEYTYHA
ncbi:DUF6382 domain-containing protein [Paenibacillus sp. CMAA1364]